MCERAPVRARRTRLLVEGAKGVFSCQKGASAGEGMLHLLRRAPSRTKRSSFCIRRAPSLVERRSFGAKIDPGLRYSSKDEKGHHSAFGAGAPVSIGEGLPAPPAPPPSGSTPVYIPQGNGTAGKPARKNAHFY